MAMEDLRSCHGLDAETELMYVYATEIALEIFREVVDDLKSNAGQAFRNIKPHYVKDLHYNLDYKLNMPISDCLDDYARMDWMIVSIKARDELLKHHLFKPKGEFAYGGPITAHEVGEFQGYRVFADRFLQDEEILIGRKRATYGTGYLYMPYVMLTRSVYLEKETFCPRHNIYLRRAKKLINPNYYIKGTWG
jgi:hypothetical protein